MGTTTQIQHLITLAILVLGAAVTIRLRAAYARHAQVASGNVEGLVLTLLDLFFNTMEVLFGIASMGTLGALGQHQPIGRVVVVVLALLAGAVHMYVLARQMARTLRILSWLRRNQGPNVSYLNGEWVRIWTIVQPNGGIGSTSGQPSHKNLN